MNDRSRATLRGLIRQRYDYLVSRLTRSIGSREMAEDALHDAYIKLEGARVADEVKQPTSYVLRMATNIAKNYRRKQRRTLGIEDALAYLDVPDDDQDLEGPVELQSELAAVERAIEGLPERQRKLLMAAWIDEVPTDRLAEQFGVTRRLVQMEIKKAFEEIRRSVSSPNVLPFRSRDRRVS